MEGYGIFTCTLQDKKIKDKSYTYYLYWDILEDNTYSVIVEKTVNGLECGDNCRHEDAIYGDWVFGKYPSGTTLLEVRDTIDYMKKAFFASWGYM